VTTNDIGRVRVRVPVIMDQTIFLRVSSAKRFHSNVPTVMLSLHLVVTFWDLMTCQPIQSYNRLEVSSAQRSLVGVDILQ